MLQRLAPIFVCFVAIVASSALAQQSDYGSLLEKAKKDPLSVNFVELRRAYVSSPGYVTRGDLDRRDLALIAATEARNFAEGERLLNEMLAQFYLRAYTHMMAATLYELKGDTQRSAFHKATEQQILGAMTANGDGRSKQTAIEVVHIQEEKDLIRRWGLTIVAMGRPARSDERSHRVWTVAKPDRPGEIFQLYFDVTASSNDLFRSMQPRQKI